MNTRKEKDKLELMWENILFLLQLESLNNISVFFKMLLFTKFNSDKDCATVSHDAPVLVAV